MSEVNDSAAVQRLTARWYPDELQCDPIARFRDTMTRYIDSGQEVIDFGAGAGEINAYELRGKVKRIVGVDLNERVQDNPLLDEGKKADLAAVPYPDGSFDVGISIYVLEHIQQPELIVREISRVLRPGGVFIALTPSRWHYVSLVAAATPTRFHQWFNERRGRGRQDTFKTAYKMNTPATLTRQFATVDMIPVEMETFEVRPNYLTSNAATFIAGAAWERLVNRFDALSPLRVNIIGAFRKA